MLKFSYRVRKAGGGEEVGQRESADRFTLARELRGEGLTVISVTEIRVAPKGNSSALTNFSRGHVGIKDKIIFASNLGSMLSAGLSLSRSLSVLSKQMGNKYFKGVINQVGEKINKGDSLSRALASYPRAFPEFFVAMIEAAEESGKLPEALKLVAEQLEKSYGLRRKVAGALIYPTIVIFAIFVITILMLIFLVPVLAATFRDFNAPLPLSTRIIISLSDFMINNIFLVLSSLVLTIVGLTVFFRSKIGRRYTSAILLHLPFITNLTCQANSALVLRTTSSLLSAGVGMTQTLIITERVVQNYYYRRVLVEAHDKVQKGLPLSAVFAAHQNLFPVFVSEMTAVGEETGRLADLLLKGAIFFENEVDQTTKNFTTILEPALMIFIGIVVGIFAIAIIGPLYSLSNVIK